MSILDAILAHKRDIELPLRIRAVPRAEARARAWAAPLPRDFGGALRQHGRLALIAEVKRASPSRGDLVKGPYRPAELARMYEAHGASAISVLTDEAFFRGDLQHLADVKAVVDIPVLRKDFVIDDYQLYEARAAGADAALLIVAALDDAQLRDLHAAAHDLGLAALVEVHSEAEVERALAAGAALIGINNRDLHTFVTDLDTTARCIAAVARFADAQGPTFVSESGIFTAAQAEHVAAMGARAILVGESIITSGDIAGQVRTLSRIALPSPALAHLA